MGRPPRVSRDDVLRAAREAFGERGYEATTLAQIAARVGVSPAALLRHAPGKEALFAAALASGDAAEPFPMAFLADVEAAEDPLRVLRARDVGKVLSEGGSARRSQGAPRRFKPGDRVLARNIHPLGHTRLPRYARGKRGVIERDHGVFVFPDTNGMGLGEKPQHCYSVRFTLRELWGPGASRRDSVHIDLWDDHLEPV